MTKQLSILGNRRTRVYFSKSAVETPTATPNSILPKNIRKKYPIASKKPDTERAPCLIPPGLYRCAVSKMTIAMASFKMDSPKITVYNFGSTLYVLKMANIVTGSVAERVAPTDIASTNEIWNPSNGMRVHSHKNKPNTTAEMKVPAKAKVSMVPMFRKKLACTYQ